jgi:choline dehydrogenase-like flavoprotein
MLIHWILKRTFGGMELGSTALKTPPLDTIYQEEYEPGDTKNVEVWAREVAASDNHVVGSLAMMPKELGGVVDTRMRMYGIENVRVVGAFFFLSFFQNP